ncbi:p21-activated protein kinase-interacting protein 1-like, partial [Myotis lucifugus]|uniref:p21-activated protein kinase-interacting protein 1-like n=1 Tax=Myotis lucifugus TaxID=59463 RepID=UPI000CCC6E1C
FCVFCFSTGTITCLKFHGNRHLISGAEDGLICVWDAKKWECLKSIKAHKGHVTFLSIHPSGKLALSVGTDKTLRTWNLVEGRSAFIKNIKQNAHIVEWSPRGEKYVVVILNKIDVYHLDTAAVSGTITNEKRVSSVTFLSESVLAVAGDEEVVRFFDTDSLMCLCEFKAHENRYFFNQFIVRMCTASTNIICSSFIKQHICFMNNCRDRGICIYIYDIQSLRG